MSTKWKNKRYRPTIRVYCSKCKEWQDEKFVEFLNIEEDFEGKDVMTFNCPDCGSKNKSHRVG